jgi:hypothetical protein
MISNMENLLINKNPDLIYFPIVNLNYETGLCEISGESYMEETYKFYEPVINWLNKYVSEKKTITFNFKLTYFNTSSSRFILEILDILKKHQLNGGEVTVNWYYKKNDPDILIEINDFIEESGIEIKTLPFDLIK